MMSADSKTVFLAQLGAILSRVKGELEKGSTSSSSAFLTTVEEWLTQIESESGRLPSGGAERRASISCSKELNEPIPGEGPSESPSETASDSTPHYIPQGNDIGSYTLVDLVQLIATLFALDAGQGSRLRPFARNLLHLVQVRCHSALKQYLQMVLFITYSKVERACQDHPLPPSPTDDHREASAMSSGFAVGADARVLSTVQLSRVIRLCSEALTECVKLVVSVECNGAEGKSAQRVSLELVVDTLKQLYKMVVQLSRSMERWEAIRLQQEHSNAPEKPILPLSDSENFDQLVENRLAALHRAWGVSLVRSLGHLCDCVSPAVSFLVSVASQTSAANLPGGSIPSAEAPTKDARDALFAFGQAFPSASPRGSGSREGSEEGLPPTSPFKPPATEASQKSFLSTFTLVLMARLGIHFSAEFAAALSKHCGDSTEGSLSASRLVTDFFHHMAKGSPVLLDCIMSQRWRRELMGGILTRIVSLQPSVWVSALNDLQVITTSCITAPGGPRIRAEISLVYTGCVLRMLESPNSTSYVKRELLLHLLRTFLQPSPRNATSGDSPVPLLLRLYCVFGLDPHAHSSNIVQQFIAALSRIVRMTPAAEFLRDVEMQSQLLSKMRGKTPHGPPPGADTEIEALVSYQQSVPLMALHGLVVAMEILGAQAPSESAVDREVVYLPLRSFDVNKRRQQEQYIVDVFSKSPAKAVRLLVDVTEEMTHPPGSEAFLTSCEAAELPSPLSREIEEKIEIVSSFIWNVPMLSSASVVDFITTPDVFSLQVCANLMRRLDLRGLHLLEALETLLSTFLLPKEGQRVERLLEYFSNAFFEANQGADIDHCIFPFTDRDACFLVVVATVMLNTNLHNPKASTKMTSEAFCGQLKGCNGDGTDFPPQYAKAIFSRIEAHPLASAASGESAAATPELSSLSIDSLFMSLDERKQLAFGLERQRLLVEIHRLLHYRAVPSPSVPPPDPSWWPGVARDLFLSTWSSVCAVFGPAMYDGPQAPEAVLPKCVRGLRALLCVAASFALPTECEAMLISIIRLSAFETVREVCLKAVLQVAASPYALFFSTSCWALVFELMISLREETVKKGSSLPALVEGVLARVEVFTRHYLKISDDSSPESSVSEILPTTAAQEGAQAETPAEPGALVGSAADATHRVLEALVSLLQRASSATSLSQALELLIRCIACTRIDRGKEGSTSVAIVTVLNIEGVCRVVLPALQDAMLRQQADEGALEPLERLVVHIFSTAWSSPLAASGLPRDDLDECFDFFPQFFNRGVGLPTVLTRILQGVGEVAASMLLSSHTNRSIGASFSVWRRLLYPIARCFMDPQLSRTGMNSLATIGLRRIVMICTSIVQSRMSALESSEKHHTHIDDLKAPMLLLAYVCYIGALCGERETAHNCLALLASLCAAGLTMYSPYDLVPSAPYQGSEDQQTALLSPESEELVRVFAAQMSGTSPHFLVQLLGCFCRLLRSDSEAIRSEIVEHLHKLCPIAGKVRGFHRYLALLLSHVVLAGTVVLGAPVSFTDPALIPFWLFFAEVPASMRHCSKSAFRISLFSILRLLTGDVLSCCPVETRAAVGALVLECCLTVLVISPLAAPPTKTTAAYFVAPCVEACADPQAHPYPLRAVFLRCLGAILVSLRAGLREKHSSGAADAGTCWGASWGMEHEHVSSEKEAYVEAVQEKISSLVSLTDAGQFTGGVVEETTRFDFMCEALRHSPPKSMVADTPNSAGNLSPPPPETPNRAVPVGDARVEYDKLLTNLLSGVPKVLVLLEGCRSEGPAVEASTGWVSLPVPPLILIDLVVELMAFLFRAFWFINHPQAVADEQPSEYDWWAELLPHTAVRGALNTYLVLSLQTPEYPLQLLQKIFRDITELMSTLQLVVSPQQGEEKSRSRIDRAASAEHSSSGLASRSSHSFEDILINFDRLEELPASVQQHTRNCNIGMYHELCAALEFWMKSLSSSTSRESEMAALYSDYDVCHALVQLLPSNGDPLITSVKLYLKWFMAQKRSEQTAMLSL